jgi:hypothetical protein
MVTQPLHKLPTFAIFFCATCQNSVVHFSQLWQFAQWLCDHWHIAAVTEQCDNAIEAEYSKIRLIWRTGFTKIDALLYVL